MLSWVPEMLVECPPAIGRLESWIRALGGRLASFEIRTQSHGGRCVQARSRIEAGTPLMEIPARCMLTALTSEALSVVLVTARKSGDSFWRPYIETLPRKFPSVPLFFGPADREFLKGSSTLRMIEDQKRRFAAEYGVLRSAFHGACPFTYGEYVWGRVAVLSRGFSLRRGAPARAIVPLADFLDHRIPPQANHEYDDAAGCFRVTTNQEIAPGTPIHVSYGASYNSLLFVNYGFALLENLHNEVYIPLPPMTVGQRMSTLLNMVRASAEAEDGCFRLTGDLASAEPVLSFLRVACAAPDERVLVTGVRVDPVGRLNEARVLAALRQACTDALDAYGGTLAEDEALLAGGQLTLNQRHAVIVRGGEKQVLHRYVELADAVLPLLRQAGLEMGRFAAAPPTSLSRFAPYLRTLGCLSPKEPLLL